MTRITSKVAADPITSADMNTLINKIQTTNATSVDNEVAFARVFNVKNYGAKGDGATDDTTAFGNAASAANAVGGGKIHVPAGVYIASIVLGNGTILEGDGIETTIIRKTTATAIVDFLGMSGHVTVRDMRIDGGSNTNPGVIGIRLGHVGGQGGNIRIDNVRITNCETGISMQGAGTQNSLWTNTPIAACKRGIDHRGLNNVFVKAEFNGCSEYAIKFLQDNDEIFLVGSHFSGNRVDFIAPSGIGAWIHSTDGWYENSTAGIFDINTVGAAYFFSTNDRLHTSNSTYLFDLGSAVGSSRVFIDAGELAAVNRTVNLPSGTDLEYYARTSAGSITPKSQNGGDSSVSHGTTISHGLAKIPKLVNLVSQSASPRIISVKSKSASTFTIGLWNTSASALTGTGASRVYWYAEV